eukprot:TRINITY_DN123_c0_g1_i1.p1 TRINITY_DN123_c0_g1~~TRINITY_DN123_c0_g1_i1.p1  ORF type:complete len:601 (-),score=119.16 TRINITY_DN123_c0_g1_i1:691-2493(-)
MDTAAATANQAFSWSLPPDSALIFGRGPKIIKQECSLSQPFQQGGQGLTDIWVQEGGEFPLASHPTVVLHVLSESGLSAEDLARLEVTCSFFRKPAQFQPDESLSLGELAAMDMCGRIVKTLTEEQRIALRIRCGGTWKLLLRFLQAGRKCYRQGQMQVIAGSGHSVAVSETGAVYTFGNGTSGELGRGAVESDWRPSIVSALKGIRVMQVAAGHGRTLFVTDKGEVYSCGRDCFGDPYEFPGPAPKTITTPSLVEGLENIYVIQAAIGHFFTAVLSREGRVYTFAWGEDGRLGHSTDTDDSSPWLMKTIEDHPVVQIAAGNCYMLALTRDADGGASVFSVGCGLGGKLGLGNKCNERFPKEITKFRELAFRPRMIAAGLFHAAAVAEDGRVATWGWGHHGCLGHGTTECESAPRVVDGLAGLKAVHVAAGDYTTFVLMENGHVYSFGAGESCSLGHGPEQPASPVADDDGNDEDDEDDDDGVPGGGAGRPGVLLTSVSGPKDVHVARRVDVLSQLPDGDRVTQVSASNFATWSSHTLALTEMGKVLSFGAGGRGQLGVEMASSAGLPAGVHRERDPSRSLPGPVHGLALKDKLFVTEGQ